VKSRSRQTKRHSYWPWLAGLVVLATIFSLPCADGKAADGRDYDDVPTYGNWKWWHIIWFHKDGTPRYSRGLEGLTRPAEKRLDIHPPYCPPAYGYNQPCWRQLPVSPRCTTCETVPPDYAVPYEAPPSPPMVPPVPPPSPTVMPPKNRSYTDPVPETTPPVLPAPVIPDTPKPGLTEKPVFEQPGAWIPKTNPRALETSTSRVSISKPESNIQLATGETSAAEVEFVSPESSVTQAVAKAPVAVSGPDILPEQLPPMPPLYQLGHGPINSDEPELWLVRHR
jgi:hypothetical protein